MISIADLFPRIFYLHRSDPINLYHKLCKNYKLYCLGDVLYVVVGQEGQSACVVQGVESKHGLCSFQEVLSGHFNSSFHSVVCTLHNIENPINKPFIYKAGYLRINLFCRVFTNRLRAGSLGRRRRAGCPAAEMRIVGCPGRRRRAGSPKRRRPASFPTDGQGGAQGILNNLI